MTWGPDEEELFALAPEAEDADQVLINGAARASDGRFMQPERPIYRTDGWRPVPPDLYAERARVITALFTRAARGDPSVALRAIRHVRALTEHLEREAVAIARGCGWSWRDVGDALGVTRSAAQRRHARAFARVRRRRLPTSERPEQSSGRSENSYG